MKDILHFDWKRSSVGDWDFCLRLIGHLTLKMASAQVVETSVTLNSNSLLDSNHPDDLFQSRYVIPGFKPFSYERYTVACVFTLSLKTMTLNLELNLILPFGRLETKVRIARATRLFSSFNQ